MKPDQDTEIAVIGAGVAGIATAYYLCTEYHKRSVLLIDARPPMSFTSAQSGDNYRNWWPHPVMARFTNDSIDLMERIALESSNVLNMTRGGYVLATRRAEIDPVVAALHAGYDGADPAPIRWHGDPSSRSYRAPEAGTWQEAPEGVDVLSNQALIRRSFPAFSSEIRHVVHIRRAGGISGQQMGQYMLERIRDAGGKTRRGLLKSVGQDRRFVLEVERPDGTERFRADVVVNAAGPFAAEVAAMLGVTLPLENVFQQKLAFEDAQGAVPRDMPFSVDLDARELDWTHEERELLAEDPDLAWLAGTLPGGTHCRPDGGAGGTWVKLGWAYNSTPGVAQQDLAGDPRMDPQFPEIVLRGAAALNPAPERYVEAPPGCRAHYGGYYPMTRENWPLIGPLGPGGAFVVGALSGFGSMAACAAGSLGAAWIAGGDLPAYAASLSLSRYDDEKLMAGITNATDKGIL
ncbi:MAG: NAD(P)/FAD-dependent oxidoreductase [Gammaproteobacteria bacterium]